MSPITGEWNWGVKVGTIVKRNDLYSLEINRLKKPIVYCNGFLPDKRQMFSINVPLAKKLQNINPHRRGMRLEQCFRELLKELPDNPVLTDYELLFNPEYQIDVLRLLVSVCKEKPFELIWAGTYENGKLIYSKEEYPDYQAFEIDNYDVTCVI